MHTLTKDYLLGMSTKEALEKHKAGRGLQNTFLFLLPSSVRSTSGADISRAKLASGVTLKTSKQTFEDK